MSFVIIFIWSFLVLPILIPIFIFPPESIKEMLLGNNMVVTLICIPIWITLFALNTITIVSAKKSLSSQTLPKIFSVILLTNGMLAILSHLIVLYPRWKLSGLFPTTPSTARVLSIVWGAFFLNSTFLCFLLSVLHALRSQSEPPEDP